MIKIRGIYSTALTEMLKDSFEIVEASDVIEERFEKEFKNREPETEVISTEDSLGLGVYGNEGEKIANKIAIGKDSFVWKSSAPRHSIFNANVKEKTKGGVSVSLGETEGFLPYSNIDRKIDEGDSVRLQVIEPFPPWSNRDTVLDSKIKVSTNLVSATLGGDKNKKRKNIGREIGRITEMLSIDIPSGWQITYKNNEIEEDISRIKDSIEKVTENAEMIDKKLKESPRPEEKSPLKLVVPEENWWVFFGRSSKFSLDSLRREVKSTLKGHHKIKTYGEKASKAVDFIEDIKIPDYSPSSIALKHFGPLQGDKISILHGKPDGDFYNLGTGKITSIDIEGESIVVKRKIRSSGIYDGLDIKKEKGDIATTRFKEGKWKYLTVYKTKKGEEKGKYINVNTPLEILSDRVQYIDLYIDVIALKNEVKILDREELSNAISEGKLSNELGNRAREVAENVKKSLVEKN